MHLQDVRSGLTLYYSAEREYELRSAVRTLSPRRRMLKLARLLYEEKVTKRLGEKGKKVAVTTTTAR